MYGLTNFKFNSLLQIVATVTEAYTDIYLIGTGGLFLKG